MTYTVGSLFSGIGGFDLAAERAGMDVLWQSEDDKAASMVLEHHWPGLNMGDIHDIRIESDLPAVDILAGGFPCQPYSVAGNRGGLAEDRGALWWEFHRLIGEGKPTWVLGENVPGLLSSTRSTDFTTIIESLVQLGYGVVWRILDAQWFGTPQRRRRIFFVGHIGGQPRPEVLALPESLCGNPAPSRREQEDSTQDLADGTRSTLVAWQENSHEAWTGPIDNFGPVSTGSASSRHLSQIITSDSGDDPICRRLTPLECERLQGFPDRWTDIVGNSETQRYKQIGNAVAVPVVEWIMERIADTEYNRGKATWTTMNSNM